MADTTEYKKCFYFPIIALLFIAMTISCSKKMNLTNVQSYNDPPSTDTSSIPASSPDTSLKSYLALGDSYTIGHSVLETERFPDQTVQLLRNKKIKITDPEIIAATGWATGNLITALNLDPPKKKYSLVSLLIGVNNQYRGGSADEYKTEFALLLNRSIQYAGNIKNNVFVISIPDYSVTPFARYMNKEKIAIEIDSFNSINKAISDQLGVNYLDITAVSRESLDDPELIAKDGLHPSGKQYKRWSELLAPMMKKSLY